MRSFYGSTSCSSALVVISSTEGRSRVTPVCMFLELTGYCFTVSICQLINTYYIVVIRLTRVNYQRYRSLDRQLDSNV